MAIAKTSSSNSGLSNLYGVASGSWAHDHSSGNVLIVGVALYNQTVTGITFNGDAMTLAKSSVAGARKIYLYYLINPDSGSHDVEVTYAGAAGYGCGGAVSFSGVDTDDLIDVSGEDTANSMNAHVEITTTEANTMVVDCVGTNGLWDTGAPTIGTGQTAIMNLETGNGDQHLMSYKAFASAGAALMEWTGVGSTTSSWYAISIALREGGASPLPTFFTLF